MAGEVLTHSVRQTYAGGPVPMWECRGCGERWWAEHHTEAELNVQPCGTRAPDPESEAP